MHSEKKIGTNIVHGMDMDMGMELEMEISAQSQMSAKVLSSGVGVITPSVS